MTERRQLPLDFDHRPALGGEEFVVTPSNAEAVAWIDRWPDWPGPALALHGPPGCGKTHLAQVFAAGAGACLLGAGELAAGGPDDLTAPACVVDDAETVLAQGLEEALLHLHNRLAEAGRHLLLAARRPPARWTVALEDLRSRLNAASAIAIKPPDDTLIAAVLVKLFADRQLRVDSDVVSFMVARMDRSFDAARRLVAALDAAALAERRNITVPLARRVVELASEED
ncbi:MAG: DnaA/Hda family protein [Rhodospirillales bacterium]|nr:DnaA/Hda family protein [Rhodospirillales bacterium]